MKLGKLGGRYGELPGSGSIQCKGPEEAGCIRGTGRRQVWQQMSSEKHASSWGRGWELGGYPVEFECDIEFGGSHWRVLNGRVK